MKYRTLKSSNTGRKLQELLDRANKGYDEIEALGIKYNFKQYKEGYWKAYGGISGIVFEKEPDRRVWKMTENGWMPKLNTKEGKAIQKEFDKLNSVWHWELNQAVGVNENYKFAGFSGDTNETYFGFEISDTWEFKKQNDCEKITLELYDELFKN